MKRIVHLPFSCKCGRNAFELLDDRFGRCTYCGRVWDILRKRVIEEPKFELV